MRIFTIALLIILAGCASDPAKVSEVADREAAGLPPPDKQFSSFAEFELKPMTFSDAIRAEERKLEEAREFDQNVRAKLLPLLDEWHNNNTAGTGTLILEPKLTGLRIVSGAGRFWGGVLAGDSFLDMEMVMIDGTTGKSIGKIQTHTESGAWAGAYSFGKSDQNIDEYVAAIIHEYLVDNY